MIKSDNDAAESLVVGPERQHSIAAAGVVPVATLCTRCEDMDFFAKTFRIEDSLWELKKQADLCGFCGMRWRIGKDALSPDSPSIFFTLVGSDLHLNGQYPPVISLLACNQNSGVFTFLLSLIVTY